MAQATLTRFEAEGLTAPILADIVALITQRCALTAQRLGKPGENAGQAH